jgi:hypothetical protein
MATLKETTVDDTGFIRLPQGTTGERPGTPTLGMTRFNTSLSQLEYWDGYNWLSFNETSGYITAATGGTITTSGNFKIHTFTSSGTFTPTTVIGNPSIEYLIVAGGGGGHYSVGGGGGAGGFTTGFSTITQGTEYTVTVGAGGNRGTSGATGSQNLVGSNSQIGTINSAYGGGGGGSAAGDTHYSYTGGSGGGGGGADVNDLQSAGLVGAPGTVGQGHPGGFGMVYSGNEFRGGGGGGGAGWPGLSAPTGNSPVYGGGTGGDGKLWYGTYYGGGGSGGSGNYPNQPYAVATNGGGGAGGRANSAAESGTTNTGGGGGGGFLSNQGGAGGSGIVIIRYRYQ